MKHFNQLFCNSIDSGGQGRTYTAQEKGLDTRLTKAVFLTIGIFAVITLFSEPAFASTVASGDVLEDAHIKVSGILSGAFAKIIAGVSLAFGLIGCVARFNAAAIASCFGVGIAAGVGPGIIESVVGAIF